MAARPGHERGRAAGRREEPPEPPGACPPGAGRGAGQDPPGVMVALPPLSLYVHVPWCVRKCPYCDFNSHGVGRDAELPEVDYLAALLADLEADLPLAAGRELASIFIGGGTPSLMSAAFY